jgi:hypothetical protein
MNGLRTLEPILAGVGEFKARRLKISNNRGYLSTSKTFKEISQFNTETA